jgi:hypothetical protein
MRDSYAEKTCADRLRLAVSLAPLALAALLSGCGSGDGCTGFVSINVSPERCAELAEDFGCDGFDSEGLTCGLFGCARCEVDD